METTSKTLSKATSYYENGKVFKLYCKNGYEFYGVEGKNGVWTVKYDRHKNQWTCDCPNIKEVYCSHIIGSNIKKVKG